MPFQHEEPGTCPGCHGDLHSEPSEDCAFAFDRRMLMWAPMGLSSKGWAVYFLIALSCVTMVECDPFDSDLVTALCALLAVLCIPGVLVLLFLGRGRQYRLVLGPHGVYVLHPRRKGLFCDWASVEQVSIGRTWGHVLLQDQYGTTLLKLPGAIFGAGWGASEVAKTIRAIAFDGGIVPVCPRCGADVRGAVGYHCAGCGAEFDAVRYAGWPYAR